MWQVDPGGGGGDMVGEDTMQGREALHVHFALPQLRTAPPGQGRRQEPQPGHALLSTSTMEELDRYGERGRGAGGNF